MILNLAEVAGSFFLIAATCRIGIDKPLNIRSISMDSKCHSVAYAMRLRSNYYYAAGSPA